MAKMELNPLIEGVSKKFRKVVLYSVGDDIFFRKLVKPKDKNTEKQRKVRDAFKKLAADWKQMGGVLKQSWEAVPKKRKIIKGYNLYIGANSLKQQNGEPLVLSKRMGEDGLMNFIVSPGNAGEIVCGFDMVNGGRHATFFVQKKENGTAGGGFRRFDAGADTGGFTLTGLDAAAEYFVYGVVTDAVYADATRVSDSVGVMCAAG